MANIYTFPGAWTEDPASQYPGVHGFEVLHIDFLKVVPKQDLAGTHRRQSAEWMNGLPHRGHSHESTTDHGMFVESIRGLFAQL